MPADQFGQLVSEDFIELRLRTLFVRTGIWQSLAAGNRHAVNAERRRVRGVAEFQIICGREV